MSGVRARSISDAPASLQTGMKSGEENNLEKYPISAVEKDIEDEPITPHSLKRAVGFQNLNEKIAHRPGKEELLNRNILKVDKVSPALQAAQQELKKRKIEDTLNHKIGKRSTVTELVDQNILPDPSIASALQSAQKSLRRSICEAELSRQLRERQPLEELVKKNIFQEVTQTTSM